MSYYEVDKALHFFIFGIKPRDYVIYTDLENLASRPYWMMRLIHNITRLNEQSLLAPFFVGFLLTG